MVVDAIRGFCKWWFLELHTLLPKRLGRICLYRRHRLLGVLDRTAFTLFEITGTRQRQLLRVGTHASELCADLRTGLRRIKRHRPRLTLRVGPELGLRKLLNLPFAARNDLDQLLRFEMDRLSPFGADNVYFAYRVMRIDPKAGSLLVEVQIVPRKIVDRARASAARLGLQASRVELAGGAVDGELNLLPRKAIDSLRISWLYGLLTVLALVFAGGLIILPLQRQHVTADDLKQQVVAQKNGAEESLALGQRLDDLIAGVNLIFDHKKSTVMRTRVLAELARVIPDNAYVVQLEINDGEVRMQGYAESVAELIGALERSSLFWKAEFLSPITTDPQNGRERFQIAVGIRTKES